MTLTLHDRILGRTKMTALLNIEVSGRFGLSHAARYSERSSDSGQNADGYLQNCFPSVHNFKMLSVKC